jgi:hypothetical protein
METTQKNAAPAGGTDLEQSQSNHNDTTFGWELPESVGSRSEHQEGSILFTRITSTNPSRLTKRFELDQDGQLIKHAGGQLLDGYAQRVSCSNLEGLLAALGQLKRDQAMTYGVVPDYPAARIVTAANQRDDEGCITRTRRYFGFRRGPGIMMFDHDGGTPAYEPAELIAETRRIAPSLANAPMAWRASASSGIVSVEGIVLTGLRGQRLYIPVSDAALIPEAGEALVNLCWAFGLGRIEVGAAGQGLERTVFDAMVWQPERLDFAAGPELGPGLSRKVPEPFVDGDPAAHFDLRLLIAETDQGVISSAMAARKSARAAAEEALTRARGEWLDEQAPKLADRRGISVDEARDVLDCASRRCKLPGDFVLHTSEGREVCVGEVLDNPAQWHTKRFADPLEPDYHGDSRIAWANLRSGGEPYLYSHAHGGRRFDLVQPARRIQLRDGARDHVVDDTLDLLRERGDLFEFGESLARVSVEGSARAVDPNWLLDHLDRVVDFFTVKSGESEERAANAPEFVARRILAKQGERGLPKLDAVITAPTLRSDGSLLNEPGYDAGSRLLLSADTPDLPYIPLAPTQDQAVRALGQLWSPFREFPLVDEVDRGVVLAAILTATVRASLPTAPGFGINAPQAGSGKTLLAQAVGALQLGYRPPIFPPTGNADEEARKRLFAALREGANVVLWDNVRDPLGNAAIDAFLTAPTFKDRVLGGSETPALPNRALFLTTGNNLRLVGDTCRRILVARIDAGSEKPYAREFDFCPLETVLSRRQELVAAALTLMRAYIAAGRPRSGTGRSASFETWDDLVRQTVCWIASWDERFDDPLKATERAYEEDPETTSLRNLLRAWHDVFGTRPVTVEQLISPPFDAHNEPEEARAARPDLNEALHTVAGDHRSINNRILGRWLAKHKERRVDGLRIVQHSNPNTKSRKSKSWCLGVDETAKDGGFGWFPGVPGGRLGNESDPEDLGATPRLLESDAGNDKDQAA